RPLYETRFVFVTANPDISSVAGLDSQGRIGVRFASQGDVRLAAQLRNIPRDQRWQRLSYQNNQILIDRVVDGEVEVGLIWEPAVSAIMVMADAPKSLVVIDPGPLSLPLMSFGIVMLSQNVNIRRMLDEAIAVLLTEGRIE